MDGWQDLADLLGDSREVHVVAREVGVHGVVDVRHVVLDVDLLQE